MTTPKQLELNFPALDGSERAQLDRDVDALRAREAAIPAEIETEATEIGRHYTRRPVRLFPAAVTFLMPRRLCVEGLGKALGPSAGKRT